MPRHAQNTLLHVDVVTCSDVLFQALVDAGPGTEADRADTLKAVVAKAAVPVQSIYDKLHRWGFDMQRLQALGVVPPGPSVQKAVIVSFCHQAARGRRRIRLPIERLQAHQEPSRGRRTAPGE